MSSAAAQAAAVANAFIDIAKSHHGFHGDYIPFNAFVDKVNTMLGTTLDNKMFVKRLNKGITDYHGGMQSLSNEKMMEQHGITIKKNPRRVRISRQDEKSKTIDFYLVETEEQSLEEDDCQEYY